MKFLKILLIIVLLSISFISYGTGTIESGDKTVYLCPKPEEKSILNGWFKNLPVIEKMRLYTYWHGLNKEKEILYHIDLLRISVNNLETRLSNEINSSADYQVEWIIYQLRHNQGKLAQIYYLIEEISGQELDMMILNSKLVDKRLNWHIH